jgi:hypothetical protein
VTAERRAVSCIGGIAYMFGACLLAGLLFGDLVHDPMLPFYAMTFGLIVAIGASVWRVGPRSRGPSRSRDAFSPRWKPRRGGFHYGHLDSQSGAALLAGRTIFPQKDSR